MVAPFMTKNYILKNQEIKIKIEIEIKMQCLEKSFSFFNVVKLNVIKQYFQKISNILKLENTTEKG